MRVSRFRSLAQSAFKASLLLLFSFLLSTARADIVILPDLVDDAQSGDLGKLLEHGGNMVSSEQPPETLAKAYAMMAVAYTLLDAKDAKDQCAGLLDILPDDLLETPAVPLIKLLSGDMGETAERSKMAGKSNDWKTMAALCELIASIRADAKGHALKKSFTQYNEARRLVRATDWSAAWTPRTKLWYSWLLHGKGNSKFLEPLIAKRKPASHPRRIASSKPEYDALDTVLTLYLDGRIAEARSKAAVSRDACAADSLIRPVLDYLSGNNSISEDSLFKATAKDAGIWALASLALFVVKVASNDPLDKEKFMFNLKNFETNAKTAANDPRLVKWRMPAGKCVKWCENGFKTSSDLPVLLQAKSVDGSLELGIGGATNPTADISTMSLKLFVASRKPYAKRPSLVGLACPRKTMQAYLDSLPKNLRIQEFKRYKTIHGIKDYIIKMLDRNPYPDGLILKRRMKVSGAVIMANDKLLVCRVRGKSKRYYWKDLSYRQYAAFMRYYAKQRLGLKSAIGKRTVDEFRSNAADDYLGLAMLFDWFKKYKAALFYAKKAAKINPKSKAAISAAMLP